MAGEQRRYGTGLYRRGNVWWVRVRIPAPIRKYVPRDFCRVSTGCTSSAEALRAARLIRAALDRSFAEIRGWVRGQMLTEAQAEAVVGQVALRRLAEAELARAAAAARTEADIIAAKARHAEEAARWRAALRHNDLAAVTPHAMAAAAAAGVPEPVVVMEPALLREAARMLAAAAEENILREDGLYVTDRSILLARLAGREAAPSAAAASTAWAAGPMSCGMAAPDAASRPEVAPAGSPMAAAAEPAPQAQKTPDGDLDARPMAAAICETPIATSHVEPSSGSVIGSVPATDHRPRLDSRCRTQPAAGPDESGDTCAEPPRAPLAEPALDTEGALNPDLPPPAEEGPPSEPARPSKLSKTVAARREELDESTLSCSTAIGLAPEAQGAPTPSDKPRRRCAVRRAERRPKRSAEISRLKRLQPEEYLDLSLKDAFALERDRVSMGGENKRWMESSNRGFSATETLALSFLGAETRIRDIHPADCEDFVPALGSIPKNWGKSAELSLPTSDLIRLANDKEEQRLLEAERLAEAEIWSNDVFQKKCNEARVPRLSPVTQYKHQSYLAAVVKTIFHKARLVDDHPMKHAIWSKKHLKSLKAAAGPQRVPLGQEGRARLFSRSIFTAGPSRPDDPLFWLPLIARYAGLRMEEACQLRPDDVGEKDGVRVFHIRAGKDQKLKSENAVRDVPIHPELVRLGILRLAAEKRRHGARWLFNVDRGLDGRFLSAFSKIYHNWRHAEKIYEPGKDFHSLRKDFYQSLKSARVDYAARIVLLGHGLNDVTETYYGLREWETTELRDFVLAVEYDTQHIGPVI